MKNNKILNVVNLINKRHNSSLIYSDNVINDLIQVIGEVYGNNYIFIEDLKTVISVMTNYVK